MPNGTVWTAAGSPYIIRVSAGVAAGDTLTLMPGTVIQLDSGADFAIKGRLLVQGTVSQPVVIQPLPSAATSLAADTTGLYIQTADEGQIEHLRIERLPRPFNYMVRHQQQLGCPL